KIYYLQQRFSLQNLIIPMWSVFLEFKIFYN
ncbi:putative transmembrane domain protein, partial [Chlamydia psittaci C1/97]